MFEKEYLGLTHLVVNLVWRKSRNINEKKITAQGNYHDIK